MGHEVLGSHDEWHRGPQRNLGASSYDVRIGGRMGVMESGRSKGS